MNSVTLKGTANLNKNARGHSFERTIVLENYKFNPKIFIFIKISFRKCFVLLDT